MLKEKIISELRRDIVWGEYKPGRRLTEAYLCNRFQVSRTPVREVLKELAMEGLVKLSPNQGASVVVITKDDVINIYDALMVIEGGATRLACSKMTPEDILKLVEYQSLLEQAVGQNNYDLIFEVNRQFHQLIINSSKNSHLIQSRNSIWALAERFGRYTLNPKYPEQIQATLDEHKKLIGAIKKPNPVMAEFLAREHLETGRKFVFMYLEDMAFLDEEPIA